MQGQFEVPVPTLAERPVDGAHCVKCNTLVDPCSKGVRLNSKSPPTFQCPVCCCKQVGLSKLFVQWPIPGFKGLDEATQRAFWQSAGTDKESLKKAVCEHVLNKSVERTYSDYSGPFLPLSVWEKRGYDVDRVRTHGKPFEDPQMGLVYQVKTWSSGDKKWEELIHEHLMKLLKTRTPNSRTPPALPMILPGRLLRLRVPLRFRRCLARLIPAARQAPRRPRKRRRATRRARRRARRRRGMRRRRNKLGRSGSGRRRKEQRS